MSEDNKFWIYIVARICIAALGITAVLTIGYTRRTEAAFAAGYEEGTVAGNSQICWIKTK
jgi:hypothetical protein